MLKQIKEKLEQMTLEAQERERAIGLQFGDPIAANTEWSPIRGGGSNFKTQKLVLDEFNNQLKVVKSAAGKVFFGLFALVGFGVLIAAAGGATGYLTDGELNEPGTIVFFTLFGLVFFLVGTVPLFMNRYLVFDKAMGYCWEGNKSPRNVIRAEETAKLIKLQRIKALQIIKEHISSSKNSYYSYELNLILEDSSRVNVMDHGSLGGIREDANKLSKYLEVPVFDACG